MSVCQRLAILAVTSITIAGCSSSDDGGDSGQPETHETKSEAQSQPKSEPKPKNGTLAALVSCAKSSGYEVDRRDRNLIAVSGSAGQGQMNVERMPTHAEAAAAAKAADLIESTVVGRLWLKYYSADESLRTHVDTCALTGTPD